MNSIVAKVLVVSCALFVSCAGTAAFAEDPCPAWEQALSRNGSDGGQLTIELDMCQVYGYAVQSMPQIGGEGMTADLIPGDLIIVWDEDVGHGDDEAYKNFTFTGSYVSDPNDSRIRLSTIDFRTNWGVYEVTQSGVFTKGQEKTNEHDVIHFYDLTLQKIDDVNDLDCRGPGEEITYTICYQNISPEPLNNVVLIDWLPQGVTYPVHYELVGDEWICTDPNYNSLEHFYLWDLGTIDPNESGCVKLKVVVNKSSTPMGNLHNIAEVWKDDLLLVKDTHDTRVCCWGGDEIYVDKDAPGPHSGTSWETAYLDLTEALDRAALGCGTIVRVANGVYQPGLDTAASFNIPDGVSVYGGYVGYDPAFDIPPDPNNISDPNIPDPNQIVDPNGLLDPINAADPNQRNWLNYPVILNGYIGENDYGSDMYNYILVTMGTGSLLDGVTVEEAVRGVDGSDANSIVTNCIIRRNLQRGIYVENGDMTVGWCDISENGFQGIHHLGTGHQLWVDHCSIHDNKYDGIRTVNSDLTLINSLVYHNGFGDTEPYYGINLLNPSINPLLRNDTIVQNADEGLHFIGLPPPQIINCILYYNNNNNKQMDGIDPDSIAYYSCIADCNDMNGNYSGPPGFAYMTEPNVPALGNYHLAYDSLCVDGGDSADYPGETDMDGEPRIFGDWIDIGADEAYACDGDLSEEDIYNAQDGNADGQVNFEEFAPFQASWLSHDPNDPVCDPNNPEYVEDPNEPGYISPEQKAHWNASLNFNKSPESFYSIDLSDLAVFWDNWLWMACWKQHHLENYGLMFGEIPMSVPESLNPIQSGQVLYPYTNYALRE